MTVVEKIYTNNKYQISIAYKSILAQLFNSVFVPIMVNSYIKNNNIYDKSGLTEDIFILAITNSLIPPLVRLIDPYYIYVSLRSVTCTLPILETRPTSFRPRSISIKCSAISFSSVSSYLSNQLSHFLVWLDSF